ARSRFAHSHGRRDARQQFSVMANLLRRIVGHRALLAGLRHPDAARGAARFRAAGTALRRDQGLTHAANAAVDGRDPDRLGERRTPHWPVSPAVVSVPVYLHPGAGPGSVLRVVTASRTTGQWSPRGGRGSRRAGDSGSAGVPPPPPG